MRSTVPTVTYVLLAWLLHFVCGSNVGDGLLPGRGRRDAPNIRGRDLGRMEFHRLLRRQSAPDCGTQGGGRRCPGNLCCSDYGWCGDGFDYCNERFCQRQYGRCGDAPPEPTTTSTSTRTTSTTSTTPRTTSTTSTSTTPTTTSTSTTPTTTSTSTSTTTTPTRASPTSTSTSTTPTLPIPSGTISTNGQCGNSTTCAGSPFGDCCSEFYFCGNGGAYCGAGCRPGFGFCFGGVVVTTTSTSTTTTPTTRQVPPTSTSTTTTTTTQAPPTTTSTTSTSTTPTTTSTSTTRTTTTSAAGPPKPSNASTDGRCGPDGAGQTCLGTDYGQCCSDFGWCGDSLDHCNPLYCQAQFGTCGPGF